MRQPSKVVETFDATIKATAQDMLDTLKSEEAIGLAAPQIGIPQQICVVDVRGSRNYKPEYDFLLDGKKPPLSVLFPMILVNPAISESTSEMDEMTEYCLSLPEVGVPVTRPYEIILHFQDIEGSAHVLQANGLLARCILHEMDHLDGKLIIDYATPSLKTRLASKLTRIRRDQKAIAKEHRKQTLKTTTNSDLS